MCVLKGERERERERERDVIDLTEALCLFTVSPRALVEKFIRKLTVKEECCCFKLELLWKGNI